MDEAGRPLFHLTKHKLRQWPEGFGLGSFHVTGWVPDAVGQQTGMGVEALTFKRRYSSGLWQWPFWDSA